MTSLQKKRSFGGTPPARFSKPWWAANKLLTTWGLLLLSARLSLGPAALIVLVMSPNAFSAVASAQPDSELGNSQVDQMLRQWAQYNHSRQINTMWAAAMAGMIVYLVVIALALSFFRVKTRESVWSGVVLLATCVAMLCYGIAGRNGTVYTSWWGQ